MMNKRNFLSALCAAPGSLGLAACNSTAERTATPRFASTPFTLGVASGAPSAHSVVLWSRLLVDVASARVPAEHATVRWELAHDDQFKRTVQSGQVQAIAELAHSVHVEVAALQPDRWYFYRFMSGDFTSPTGRTRTLPAIDSPASALRLAYASCQRYEHGYFSAYGHMLADAPDLVLFLGDYIYEYAAGNSSVRKPLGAYATDLDSYRQRYASYKSEAPLQAMHAACPWIIAWDDHEVQNDYAGSHRGDGGPPIDNFLNRRRAAYQAWYEHQPVRASALTRALTGLYTGAELRIYDSYALGQLGALHLLDTRQYRDPQACNLAGKPGSGRINPAACANWHDPARSLLGKPQETWLAKSLASTRGPWNLIGQTTVYGQRDNRRGPGQSLSNDTWDGYPAARARTTAALIRNTEAMPVLLGGDVHANWVGHIRADYNQSASKAVGVEFCGTSVTASGGTNHRLDERLSENPHFVFADEVRRGYGIVDIKQHELNVRLRVTSDVTQAQTSVQTLAQFKVKAGVAELERLG
jgi:alkaline phosphatase D